MTRQGRHPFGPHGPCPEHAEACTLLAWGEPVAAEDRAHIDTCPRCSAAVQSQRVLSESAAALAGSPPAQVRRGLTGAVLAATTRSESQARRRPYAWTGAAALAAAGLAGLVWWRGRTPGDDTMPDFAEVDLELLEDLDLAENLDLLEVLDALEELDDA